VYDNLLKLRQSFRITLYIMFIMDSRCAYPVPTLSSVKYKFVPLNSLFIHLKDNCTKSVPTGNVRTGVQTGANIHKYLVKELRL